MDRRTLLALLVAGCADPAPDMISTSATTPLGPSAATPGPLVQSGDPVFDAWAQDFYARATAQGVSADLLKREMAGLTPDPRVADRDTRQPEFAKPFSDYIKSVVTDDRVALGRRRREDLRATLEPIQAAYGVPGDILLAVWAMETGFGAILGNFDVFRSMASLAAQGRRRKFAEDQLLACLKIIESGEFPRSRLTGSWAGAMGQTQFIPTTFLAAAVDADGDGRRDIWGSSADALASAANLLAKGGWRAGQSWALEAVLPAGFDYSLTEGVKQPPAAWEALGVRRLDGRAWSAAEAQADLVVISPTGAAGPAFLLLPNHFVIRKYNNATTYALAVGLLADRFGGAGALVRPWPQETALSLDDRIASQKALRALGFDPESVDGVVGVKTRAALRAWQKARGLTADGYLSTDMISRLKVEAAALPAPPV